VRPDWASGPEWEGQFKDTSGYTVCVRIEGNELHIKCELDLGDGANITCESPAAALAAANDIAEACGGWEK